MIFGVLFVLPFLARSWTPATDVATFWIACVMARPFGASVNYRVGVPRARGGVGIGTGLVLAGLEVGGRRAAESGSPC